ncbi:MAG TPA: GNAT family N-acetyltransferase [Intrasporangium sp.]|uniref:GNAT family N-acetyltransferase n=1 Tax=Intrasporangium sp. TaxID=1925024 RepID=UPI002B4A0AC3|nr:GNAT family N-acetyltransferase [Intrasporangium sp.]HKX69281.1 GNAT family N-acetyltransferase [Intrasporangium sp.]
MSDLRIRDVSEADLPSALVIRTRSFGPLGPGGRAWWDRVAKEVIPGRMLAVVDENDTLLATGRARPYEQVWGGRHLRMGGIAGVYAEPSARGRGVATLLMRGLVERMGQLGDVVSCLFPTAPELYRSVGYEVGGVQPRYSYAAHDVRAARSRSGGLRPRPAGPGDAELIRSLMQGHQERHALSGPMLPTVATWREHLEDEELINYVLDEGRGRRGFVSYSLAEEVLTVEELVGESAEVAAALWAVVGSGSSAAPTVRSYLDPRDPGRLLFGAMPEVDVREHVWMLRVVDLPGAMAARGFSPHVTASAEITLADPEVPANSGHWEISVAAGAGRARLLSTRSEGDAGPAPIESAASGRASTAAYGLGDEPTRLGPRGMAGLWCGWTMSRLRAAGLASGGAPESDRALDAMFACTPFMTEYF